MDSHINPPKGSLTLIGSGEMAPAMSRVHRSLLDQIPPPVRAVFIDTPAGFQLNVGHISDKAVQYFKKHFSIPMDIASYKASDAAPADENRAIESIRTAGYILAGPGSPSYTVRHWRGTRILSALYSRLMDGAHLVFASAASIAVSSFALPVYEIYKVGEPPHWLNGLGFLAPLGFNLAIIPHWNNREGGTHDTRFCYMGAPRFKALEKLLPPSAAVIGIDEHTALTLDFSAAHCRVTGAGAVTLRRSGEEVHFPAGHRFDMKRLTDPSRLGTGADTAFAPLETTVFSDENESEEKEAQGEIPEKIIQLLVDIRSRLRADHRWDMADEIRAALSSLQIRIEDGPDGSSWKKIG